MATQVVVNQAPLSNVPSQAPRAILFIAASSRKPLKAGLHGSLGILRAFAGVGSPV
jgi:hypothetical protein